MASALVAAAERRLYEAGLKQVQLEFEYQRGDPQSERLLAWYEGSCGFTGPSTRSSGFRRCRKGLRQPKPAKQTASPETQAAAEECTLLVRVTDDAAVVPAHVQSSKAAVRGAGVWVMVVLEAAAVMEQTAMSSWALSCPTASASASAALSSASAVISAAAVVPTPSSRSRAI